MSSLYNFFPQEIISSIGWTLLHSLWQGGVIAVTLYITLYLVRNKSANIKTLISTAALLLLVVTTIITYNIEYNSASLTGNFQAGPAHEPVMGNSIDNHGNLASGTGSADLLSRIYTGFQLYFSDHVNLVFAIWIAGLFLFALRFFGGLFYLARIRSKISVVKDAYWNDRIETICKKINLKAGISLAESAYTRVPVVIGYFKPVILFPFGLLTGLPPEQIEAILAHELAHLKRYDLIINLFQSVAETIFFYNPFVWWISNKIRIEREFCCDDIAIDLCGNELVYAKALVNLESLIESNMPLFAIPLFKNKNQLLRRIKRMLHKNENRNSFKEKFAAAIIFIGVLISAAVFKNVNATTANQTGGSINAGAIEIINPASPVFPTAPAQPSLIDTIITKKKGTSTFTFSRNENGTEVEYRTKLKDGKLISLFVDDVKVDEKDFGKYKNMIEEMVKKHQADMAKHEQDMKKHNEDMKKHEQDMKKHNEDMKKHELDMKKYNLDMQKHAQDMKKHEYDMQKHAQDMKKHEFDKQKYEQEMKIHEKNMQQHEIEMKKHAQEMKLHEIEMKKHEAFMKDLRQMLVEEGVIKSADKNINMKLNSNRIIVEGDKLSDEILNKAKKLYKKHFGKEMSSDNSITIDDGGSSISIKN